MSFLAFLVHAAHAGPSLGLGLGALVLPGEERTTVAGGNYGLTCDAFRGFRANGEVDDLKVVPVNTANDMTDDDETNTTCKGTKSKLGVGARLTVPLRIPLTETTWLRVTGDLDFATVSNGSFVEYTVDLEGDAADSPPPSDRWAVEGEGPYRYLGVRSVMAAFRLTVGPEFAFRPESVTPYMGAAAGLSAQYTYNGLGHNGAKEGWESGVPMTYRPSTWDCKNLESSCVDISSLKLVPVADVHVGVMNTGDGLPFFVEASYSVSFVGKTTKVWGVTSGDQEPTETATVTILPYHYRPIALTAGLVFPL